MRSVQNYWRTYPHNTELKANYLDVDAVDIDCDRFYRRDLAAALVAVLGQHLKSRERVINVAVLCQGVGAVAREAVVRVIKGVVEGAHDPAGARLRC